MAHVTHVSVMNRQVELQPYSKDTSNDAEQGEGHPLVEKLGGSDSPEEDEDSCTIKCPKSPCRICCYACGCLFVSLVVLVLVLLLAINNVAKTAIDVVGTSALGVPVSVGSVDIALFTTRSRLSDFTIASPSGFNHDFLTLEQGVFGLSVPSLFYSPFELENMDLKNLDIHVETKTSGDSNAARILNHVHSTVEKLGLKTKNPSLQDLTHLATKKIIVDELIFANISATFCLEVLCFPTLTLVKVKVTDVGKKQGGVYVYEFLEIVVQALLIAALRAAPSAVGGGILPGLGHLLQYELDYGQLHSDIGAGLKQISAWTATELEQVDQAARAESSLMKDAVRTGSQVAVNALESAFHLQGSQDPVKQALEREIEKGEKTVDNELARVIDRGEKALDETLADLGDNNESKVEKSLDSFLGDLFGDDKATSS